MQVIGIDVAREPDVRVDDCDEAKEVEEYSQTAVDDRRKSPGRDEGVLLVESGAVAQ